MEKKEWRPQEEIKFENKMKREVAQIKLKAMDKTEKIQMERHRLQKASVGSECKSRSS